MKRNYVLYTLAWLFLIPLLPLMLVGSVGAIIAFTIMIGFKYTAKILVAWSNKI